MRRLSCYSLKGFFATALWTRQNATFTQRQLPGDWVCPNCANNNFSRRDTCFSCSLPKPTQMGEFTAFGGETEKGGGVEGIEVRQRKSSSPAVREGDWVCRRCSAHNFAHRTQCIGCENSRPAFLEKRNLSAVARRGAGHSSNRVDVTIRRNRSERREDDVAIKLPLRALTDREELLFGNMTSPGMPPPKVGDWRCGGCQYVNFQSRATCKTCGTLFSDPRNMAFTADDVAEILLRRKLGASSSSASHHGGVATHVDSLTGSPKTKSPQSFSGDWTCVRCDYSNFASRIHCNRCGSDKATASSASVVQSSQQRERQANNTISEAESLEAELSKVLGSDSNY